MSNPDTGKGREVGGTGGRLSRRPSFQITPTDGSIPSRDQEIAAAMGRLAITSPDQKVADEDRLTVPDAPPRKKGKNDPRETRRNEVFPADDDPSSDSEWSLTGEEKEWRTLQGEIKVKQAENERNKFGIQLKSLHEGEFTIATSILGAAWRAAKEIKRFGNTRELALATARAIDRVAGNTDAQRCLFRWIDCYDNVKEITALNNSDRLESGYDRRSPAPLGYLFRNLSYQPPDHALPGPVQHYNKHRDALKVQMDSHNHKNRQYNDERPHQGVRQSVEPAHQK